MDHIPALLERCFRRARSAPERSLPDAAPIGFATRVLAQLQTPEARDWTLWLLPRAVAAALLFTTGLLTFLHMGEVAIERDLEAGLIVSALEAQP